MKRKGDTSPIPHNRTKLVDPDLVTAATTALSDTTKSTLRSLKAHQQHMGTNNKNNNNNGRSFNILPRLGSSRTSQEYELVEGGQLGSPQRRGSMMASPTGAPLRKRFSWRVLIVSGLAIFAFVALFGPRERRKRVLDAVVNTYEEWNDAPAVPSITSTRLPFVLQDDIATTAHTTTTTPHPVQTYPSDDTSKASMCTKPYTPNKPLIQWSLIIDAGSTGSRIHVYKFHNCNPTPSLESEVFEMTQPGLSDYAKDPEKGAESLDVLLKKAVKVVPKDMQKCTPVVVKATAGLRLLGHEQSSAILDAVRERLKKKWPFPVPKDGVVIMDGKDEGVYAWITVNYLFNSLNSPNRDISSTDDPASLAVLDLGGASTQIVFEPTFTKPNTKFEEGEHKYRLEFNGRSHVLYQHSYLGYGLMQARQSVHRLVEFLAPVPKVSESDDYDDGDDYDADSYSSYSIPNACLARGTDREVEIVDLKPGGGGEEKGRRKVIMTGADVGSFEGCKRIMELVMAKDALCTVKPCSFNGVYQPSLIDTFPTGPILLLSYFYDRLYPILQSPSSSSPSLTLPISSLRTFAQQVCQGEDSWKQHWGTNAELMNDLQGRPEYCLDLTFMYTLLRLGYELDDDRQVRIAKKVGDTELGWCLGAAIVGLEEGGLVCEV